MPGMILLLLNAKVADIPLTGMVVITVPLSTSDTDVTPVGSVIPRIKLLKVTALLPGLVSWTCWMVTPEAPAACEELEGGFDPAAACTITCVEVAVKVAVEVEV